MNLPALQMIGMYSLNSGPWRSLWWWNELIPVYESLTVRTERSIFYEMIEQFTLYLLIMKLSQWMNYASSKWKNIFEVLLPVRSMVKHITFIFIYQRITLFILLQFVFYLKREAFYGGFAREFELKKNNFYLKKNFFSKFVSFLSRSLIFYLLYKPEETTISMSGR